MSETNIKLQIEEDIQEYQAKFSHIPNIDKPEWAFNFWVLDKLYSLDEEIIPDRIIDYNDKGFTRVLTALKNSTYSHSPELQNIYTKFSGKSSFAVKLLLYKEPVADTKSMVFQLQTPNNGTTLSVNNEAYKLNQAIDAIKFFENMYNKHMKTIEQIINKLTDKKFRRVFGICHVIILTLLLCYNWACLAI